jgi:nucleoside-diphosphate-sugar epimerase
MVLVTGGTGLLGSHLLFELLHRGEKVRAIYRDQSRMNIVRKIFSYYTVDADDLFDRIAWFKADLLDLGSLEDALVGITQVYHAGAIVSFRPKDYQEMLRINIDGTANLVNLCIGTSPMQFCFISSVATLGRADHDGISDEETYWKPSRKNSIYSISKYGAEREVWRGIEEGLNALIVNPSVILGPGFWGDGNSGLFTRVWKGLKFYTNGINGFIDVRDVAAAMIDLMNRDYSRERFILSSGNCTYREVVGLMARYLNKPAPFIHVPPAMAQMAWRIERVRSLVTGTPPNVTRETATTASQVYRYSNEKVQKAIHFNFRSVEESIRDTCTLFLKDHQAL